MTTPFQQPKNFAPNQHLVHASPYTQLETLKPLSKKYNHGEIINLLYATSCPVYAFGHALRYKTGAFDCFLYQYKILGKHYIFCSIPEEKADAILSASISLYFVDPHGFVREKKLRGILERLTLGLVKNSHIEWVSLQETTPTFTLQITLGDICPHIYTHRQGQPKLSLPFKRKRLQHQ